MNAPKHPHVILLSLIGGLSVAAIAQDAAQPPPVAVDFSSAQPGVAAPGATNAPAVSTNALTGSTNAVASSTNAPATDKPAAPTEIQVSFQGANIDMITQWLAQQTGKSVVKHPQVQCQLNITSSKKVPIRDAINLVYRALALEGFSAIELSNTILIVPEGKEPKLPPELVDANRKDIPEGRQRLVKIFPLAHSQASDIKEKVRGVISEKGTIDTEERANQLIVVDYSDNLRLMAELIKEIDVESSDLLIKTYAMKHVEAEEMGNLLNYILNVQPSAGSSSSRPSRPMGMSMSMGDSMSSSSGSSSSSSGGASQPTTPPVRIWPDKTSNRLIITAPQSRFKAIEELIEKLDIEDAMEKTTRTFPLKNADAQDVAKQLQELNRDQESNSRYPFYYFSSYSSQSSQKNNKKMNVVADRRRNSLIIQAPPAQMDVIQKMVEELDKPVDDGSLAPKIYPLKFVSASDIEDVLNELFLKKQQQRSYWSYYDDYESQSTPDRDVGRLYGKVRITSEPNANVLIVTANSTENLAVVETVLKQLDAPSEAGESTLRVALKYAKASTVANAINILFAKNGSPPLRPVAQQGPGGNVPQQQQNQQQGSSSQTGFSLEQEAKEDGYFPWLGGQPDNPRSGDSRNSIRQVSDLVGRVRAVADQRGNAIVISANVHFLTQVLKLVSDLDAPTEQVLIEARLVEVSSDFLDKLGVRWSPDGSKVFTAEEYDNSFLGAGNANYMKGFGSMTTVNSPASASGTVGQALTSLRSGVLDGSVHMDFLVQFLRKNTDAKVLAAPQINIRDNETGRLFVGQQVPIPQNTQVSQLGGQNTSFTYKDVGVVLEVTPHINSTGDVELKIHAESSTVVPGQTVLGGSIFDTRNFRTDLTAKNGQTLVLGGIIQKQVTDTIRKTPILGSIPGLGWAFKKKDKTSHEVELMVFLHPRICRTPEETKDLLDETYKKAPLIKDWEDDARSPKGGKKPVKK